MSMIIVILILLEIIKADYCTCYNRKLNDLSKCTSILGEYCEINCQNEGIIKFQLDVLDVQNSQFNNCIKIEIISQSIYFTNVSFTASKFQENSYYFKTANLQIYQNLQNSLFGSILMFDGDHIQITNATINTKLLSLNSISIHITNSTIQTNNKSCSQGELIDFLQIVPDKYSFYPNMDLDVNKIIQSMKLNNLRELFIQIQQTTNNYTLLIISKHIQLDNPSKIIAARIGIFSETIIIHGNITAQPDCLINQGPGRGPRFIMDQGTCNGAGGSSAGNGGIGSSLNNKDNCLKLFYSARSFIKQHSYNGQSYINSGSGGAGSTSYYSGGGFIIIHTNYSIELMGNLNANGENAQGASGGGGGGSISLKSMNIYGMGTINAKGGDSDETSLSGEGGGGLIKIMAYKEQNTRFQMNVSKGKRIYLENFFGSDGTIWALSCPQGTELNENLQCHPCLEGMFSFGNRGKCYKCPGIEIGSSAIQLPECPVNICNQYQCDPIKFIFDSIFSLLGFSVILLLFMFVVIGYLLRRSYIKRTLNHEKLPFDFETATRYMIIDHLLTEELMQNDNFQLVDLMYHAHRITIVGNNSYNFPWYMPLQPAQEIQYLVEADEYKRFASKINSIAEWNTSQKILIYYFSILYYPLHWWYMIRIKKSKYLEIESFFNQQDMKFMKMLDDEFIQVKLSKSADYTILYLDIFNYKWSDLKYFFLACPYYIQLSGEGTFIRPLYLCESNPFLTCLYFSINITLEKEIDDERNKILENLVHHKIRMENSQKLNRFIIKFNRYARAIDLDSRSIINDVRNLLIFMQQWNEKFFSKCQIKINLFVIFNEEFTILENYDSPQFSSFLQSMKNKNIRFGLFIFDMEADLEEIDDVLENQRISFEESSHNTMHNSIDPLNEFSMDDLKERYIEREKILLHSQSQSILSSVYSDSDRLEIEKSRIERIFGFIRTIFMTHQIPTLNKYTNLALQVVATSIDALLLPVQFLGSWENISQGQLVFSSIQLYLLPYPLSIPISEILGLLWISSQSYGIAKAHLMFVVLSAFNLLLHIILLIIEKQFLVMSIPVNIQFYNQLVNLVLKLILIYNTKRILSLNIKLNKLNQLKHIIQ